MDTRKISKAFKKAGFNDRDRKKNWFIKLVRNYEQEPTHCIIELMNFLASDKMHDKNLIYDTSTLKALIKEYIELCRTILTKDKK